MLRMRKMGARNKNLLMQPKQMQPAVKLAPKIRPEQRNTNRKDRSTHAICRLNFEKLERRLLAPHQQRNQNIVSNSYCGAQYLAIV
jgi:hypothetical protein